MIRQILSFILGTNNARQLRKIQPIVAQINAFEPEISALSDEQLAQQTVKLRQQLAQGKTLDDILPEAFATVREAAKRKLGQRHYDVQLIGGIVLHQGKIAEMKTGEGKTLTATLALYLNALEGKGAHLVTVNDYLARRDAEWMAPVYTSLGLTVGCIQNTMNDAQRKEQYQADILYGTNNEFGFDYLRDNMKFRIQDYVQRELNFAIVDEVDSILIDEARTPLIISGPADQASQLYVSADRAVSKLQKGVHYEIDEKQKSVQLTEAGNDVLEQAFGVENLYAIENLTLLHHVTQALRAHALFKKDVEYVVKDGELLIVDEFTGRILPGRRYSDGLHQALEAKEGLNIEQETQTLASITLQNYFRLYKKLAGMTGTAATEAEEFYKIYKLDVISVPTNRPLIRLDKPDLIFLTQKAKYQAIIKDIQERHAKGQPILIGTISIETSELLSSILTAQGVAHEVLNAKQHAREADIVAYAGQPGKITIATNMAGRGTDIKLTPESIMAGGLYVLGTERHESRRIDNQLRGRSGRQGDPGETRFYISLEDDLIRIFAGDTLKKRMQLFGMKEDETIESSFVSKRIETAQERVEKHNFEIRKHLLEYDDVLNQQRIVVYRFRKQVLEGTEHIEELVHDMVRQSIEDLMPYIITNRTITPENLNLLYQELAQLTGLKEEQFAAAGFSTNSVDQLQSDVIDYLLKQYALYRAQKPTEVIASAEKWLMLENIDMAWKQNMLNLDHLKEGIGLRGYGQKNPLIEYKREAFAMFTEMMTSIRRDIVHHLFHVNIETFDPRALEVRRERELEDMNLVATPVLADQDPVTNVPDSSGPRVGRNDPCFCGSGKKFKKCHGA